MQGIDICAAGRSRIEESFLQWFGHIERTEHSRRAKREIVQLVDHEKEILMVDKQREWFLNRKEGRELVM